MKVVFGEREVRAINRWGIKPLLTHLLLLGPVNGAVLAISRRLLSDRIAHRLPLRRAFVDYRLDAGDTVHLLSPDRDIVARDIFWGKGKPTNRADARVLTILEALCKDARTFLDVGTYAGLFALVAARANPELTAVAYDIVPENFMLTQRNIIVNDLVGRVECRLTGLGEAAGSLHLPDALGLSSNATSVSLGSTFSGGGTQVPVVPLDAEAEAAQWTGPIVMKIDVEGFEVAVLKGGANLLARHRPDIICEVLPGDPADTHALESLLRPLGYRFYHPTADGLVEHPAIAPSFEARDWLFSAREDLAFLNG